MLKTVAVVGVGVVGAAVLMASAGAEPPVRAKSEKQTDQPGAVAPAKREPSKFDEAVLKVAMEYKTFARVSDRANWAPAMCKIPAPTGAQLSVSKSEGTHGRKLYFLYAKDAKAYDTMSSHGTLDYPGTKDPKAEETPWVNPVGQVVVKEAFKPVEVAEKDRPEFEKDIFGHSHLPAEYVELDGKLHKTGDAAGLFIMLKLDQKTEGTDKGWVYAVTAPDNKSVIDAGRIASCMECHEKTTRDRLYGHKWSWPRAKDEQEGPPIKPSATGDGGTKPAP